MATTTALPAAQVKYDPGCPLSKRQLEVVRCLADGMTQAQTALELCISESTVRTHTHDIYTKLGVANQAQAVIYCYRRGWVTFVGDDIKPALKLVLDRLTEATERLANCLVTNNPGWHNRLSLAHRDYLDAFDHLLFAHTETQEVLGRKMLDQALDKVLANTPVVIGDRPKRDLAKLLIGYIQRARP